MLIRRSNLMVPITNSRFVSQAWKCNADAITLDLEDGVMTARKVEARSLVNGAIGQVGRGAADVFVRVNKPFVQADLEACVWPGLRGIMLPEIEAAVEVVEAADLLTAMERQRGLPVGSLEIIVVLESARAVWDIREIITASPRLTQVGVDESDLASQLSISPVPDYDPFVYARGRLIVEAIAAQVQPIGMAYPLGMQPRLLPADDIIRSATDAKNLGYKGIVCPHPSWVAPVNSAFTPTAEQVASHRRIREAFAAGVAAGTAAVPLDGRMVDVPVDEWSKVVLAMADACATRDAEKHAARTRLADTSA
jgi:citrate lyase subunit beta/citryl-CoA lyase